MKKHRLGYAGSLWVKTRASRLLQDPRQLQNLLRDAELKPKQRLGAARDQLALLLRLLKAWISGDYRHASRTTLLAAAAAVLYFVLPLDLIPDVILGAGLVDDIAVIAWVVNQIREELERFRAWEAARSEAGAEAPSKPPAGSQPAPGRPGRPSGAGR